VKLVLFSLWNLFFQGTCHVLIFIHGTCCVPSFCLVSLMCHDFFFSWSLYIYFSPHETDLCWFLFMKLITWKFFSSWNETCCVLIFVSRTCCGLILVHETCYMFILLVVKLVHWVLLVLKPVLLMVLNAC